MIAISLTPEGAVREPDSEGTLPARTVWDVVFGNPFAIFCFVLLLIFLKAALIPPTIPDAELGVYVLLGIGLLVEAYSFLLLRRGSSGVPVVALAMYYAASYFVPLTREDLNPRVILLLLGGYVLLVVIHYFAVYHGAFREQGSRN